MRSVKTSFVGAALFALALLAFPANALAFDWGLKLEPGMAAAAAEPQSRLFGPGFGGSIKGLIGIGRYLDARHAGATAREAMTVRVGVEFDEPTERALVRDFVRAFVASLALGAANMKSGSLPRNEVEKWVVAEISEEKVIPMFSRRSRRLVGRPPWR